MNCSAVINPYCVIEFGFKLNLERNFTPNFSSYLLNPRVTQSILQAVIS